MNTAIEIRDAFRIFGAHADANVALQGLTFTVESGEVVVILGPSGSGKTTLLRVLGGFEQLSAGTIRVFGTALDGLSRNALAEFRAKNLGFLDQHYARALSPDLSCRETVALQLRLQGRPRDEAVRIADRLLERVGLAERGGDRPEQLSGGEQQRVALCAAIAHRPRLVLADEPAGELDLESATTVYRLLGEIAREVGATLIVVSHDVAAATIADRLVQIRDGRLVEETVPGQTPSLVVSRGGWVRLPLHVPDSAARVEIERRDGALLLRPHDWSLDSGAAVEQRSHPRDDGSVVAELRDIVKAYGERVLFDGLNREFRAGQLTAVVGRSGVGKTTLLHLLAGLERPTAGDVVVRGERLSEMNRSQLAAFRRQAIGLVMQDPGLVPYLSVYENVALALTLRGANVVPTRVTAVLEHVGLAERARQRASSLSAGERERVAIARAIAVESRLLLIDEPTARLDEESGRKVAQLLVETAAQRGVAVVCATHDPVLVERAAEVIDLELAGLASAAAPAQPIYGR